MFELICKNLERTKIDSIFDGNDGDSVISYGFEDIFKYFTSFRFVSFFKAVSAYAQVHRKSKKACSISFGILQKKYLSLMTKWKIKLYF